MKITALRIENYKGFFDSGYVELNPRWNVIVGQNNAGKTAFMEGLRFSGNPQCPHKDMRFPENHVWPPTSVFHARMKVPREWVKRAWLTSNNSFDLPISQAEMNANLPIESFAKFFEGDDLNLELTFPAEGSVSSPWPSHRLFDGSSQGHDRFVQMHPSAQRTIGPITGLHGGRNDSIPGVVDVSRERYIYLFDAKRLALGECEHADTRILEGNARNLAAVLVKLNANPSKFREFVKNVGEAFPSVKDVTVTTKGQRFEVKIWPVDSVTEREDLAVPLDQCGTGVGQVLAILYVAMTNEPGVIAIDEPNSFLHPGAAKALIQILKRYNQHQYIISTHSPEIIGAAQPAALHLVRFDGFESRVMSFPETEVDTLRMTLEEVGSSISDVFSVDRVVYVEGPTEKECFDLIARRVSGGPIVGFAFVALRNTGDFEGRSDTKAILDIYDTLSRGGSILPATVGFSFDREGKTEKQIEELKRRCGGRARVLPRRMTENYLLSPKAIAIVLTALGESSVDEAAIEALLNKHAPNRMANNKSGAYGSDGYFDHADAAKLLSDVFHEASEGRQEYRKVRDGVALLKAILDSEPESVTELVKYVRELIASTEATKDEAD